ncbi:MULTISPECIES: DUF1206 domain-containing protein [unclassified Roseitalea]|uniref:DUF1206 domain-containing protein n=1 Tax=unclassified Roseitalea TaxID=2639107 RepID=UPI00273E5428|nr:MULTISPECIES: DUF1206 domain-containing protein [unclassified Roseitalea]
MGKRDLSWAVPMMRSGYAGRGLVYVAVAGLSLWAIWRGGQAEGTSSAFRTLETSTWGVVVLSLIGAGLLAYALWRVTCAIYDLEAYGSDGKGLVARAGQVTTGVVHGAIGVGAITIVLAAGGGTGNRSSIVQAVGWLMSLPAGIWLVGVAGLLTIGSGIYYYLKAWNQKYLSFLRANEFTLRWNTVLRAGVVAQATVVTIIGAFIVYAALRANPAQAGGLGQTFSWLKQQPYGQALVIAICLGLLAFALFCFVNARYRIVPRTVSDDRIETLARRLKPSGA